MNKIETLLSELIEEFYRVNINDDNFTGKEKFVTISILMALKGFHSEEGTTVEQNILLKQTGLKR